MKQMHDLYALVDLPPKEFFFSTVSYTRFINYVKEFPAEFLITWKGSYLLVRFRRKDGSLGPAVGMRKDAFDSEYITPITL